MLNTAVRRIFAPPSLCTAGGRSLHFEQLINTIQRRHSYSGEAAAGKGAAEAEGASIYAMAAPGETVVLLSKQQHNLNHHTCSALPSSSADRYGLPSSFATIFHELSEHHN